MSTPGQSRAPHLTAVLRETESVTPLELFFDLVFVLALTQCTSLMAHTPTWTGVAKGLVILGVLWWSWVGYAWLTSVVDPEEGTVRLVMFVAMAAFLITALAVPHAFENLGLLFAVAYAVVRVAQVGLFALASRDDPELRRSMIGFSVSTAVGVSILVAASGTDGTLQGGLWLLALLADGAGPYISGADGWKLVPQHFAERHGLIVIIALGESIVAIGVGAEHGVDTGVVVAAILGMGVSAALWWMYFDVVALVAARRLDQAAPGREQNEIARDSFSYLHFPMVAGIVLVAFGLKKTIGDTGEHLKLVPTAALLGGAAIYLIAHVLFRLRNVHRFSSHRLITAVLLVALIPVGDRLPAITTLAMLFAILVGLVVYERIRFAELREKMRHQLKTARAEGSVASVSPRRDLPAAGQGRSPGWVIPRNRRERQRARTAELREIRSL